MAGDEVTRSIDRTLKEISQSLKQQNHILKDLSQSLVRLSRPAQDSPTESPEQWTHVTPDGATHSIEPPEPKYEKKPRNLGWSMAASLQREGALVAGDIKHEQDESRWVWIGSETGWERMEEPGATD